MQLNKAVFNVIFLFGFIGLTAQTNTNISNDPEAVSPKQNIKGLTRIVNSTNLFYENFEVYPSGWTKPSAWAFGEPSTGPNSGYYSVKCAATRLGGEYSNYASANLQTPSVSLLQESESIHFNLEFVEWFEIEEDHDYGSVLVSNDGGTSWDTLDMRDGQSDWRTSTISLDDYAGDDIKIGFYFKSDNAGTALGWYIDNVKIIAYQPLEGALISFTSQNFPMIYANVSVDTFDVGISSLTQSNFDVYENGVLQTDHFEITPPEQSGSRRLVDIIFIMDNSESMDNEMDSISANVISFVNDLQTSGVDYALGLCRYGQHDFGGDPLVQDYGILTTDADYFKNEVWARNAAYGGTEPGFEAIKTSSLLFNFRPGSQKVFILITDETPAQGDITEQNALTALQSGSITLFALIKGSLSDDVIPITTQTNGDVYDIYAPFTLILDQIRHTVANNYVVTYKSSNTEYDGVEREVQIVINYSGMESTVTAHYIPGSEPTIERTAATLEYHTQPWAEGTTFTIQAWITDDYAPFVKYASLFYRKTGDELYTVVTMEHAGVDLFTADIPGNYVDSPGMDYYLIACDSISTTSSPETDPAVNPYQIAVLPNVAPEIIHSPVTFAQTNTNVTIEAQITDVTNSLAQTMLYYRAIGQLAYQNVSMDNSGGDDYSAVIPNTWVTNIGLEYYLKATDNFNVSTYNGTASHPNKINVAAIMLQSEIDTLEIGPTRLIVPVPENGSGYFYLILEYLGNPVYSSNNFSATLFDQNFSYEIEGLFLSPGIMRFIIPSNYVQDSTVNFSLADHIMIGDTLYTFDASEFEITANRISAVYTRSWDVFAGGSAGVSGTVGSIGAGVSAAAAKLSVKGSAGGGLTFTLDQTHNMKIDRRFEASIKGELSVPAVNAAVGQASIGSSAITAKMLLGQQFCFTDINLDEDTKKMAQAGFVLETMAVAGLGLSPVVGPILSSIVTVLNQTSGVSDVFQDAKINDYWGAGLEGSLSAGFRLNMEGVKFDALTSTAAIVLNCRFNTYSREVSPLMKLNMPEDISGKSIVLSQAFTFDFSTLNYGFNFNDNLFDGGIGAELSTTVNFTPSNSFDGMTLALKGGGGYNIFGGAKDTYYSTEIELPKEYGQIIANAGNALAGFFTSSGNIPLGPDLITTTVDAVQEAYTNIQAVPLSITTSEIRGKGFELNLSIELDAALIVGAGISLGVNGKYYDEVSFPKKISQVYLNGNNYLLSTSNYSSDMEEDNFSDVMYELLSGVLPLIQQSFENILNTVSEIYIAGRTFILSALDEGGEILGGITGTAQQAGEWVITTFNSWLPQALQKNAFEKPEIKMMYSSTRVMHPRSINMDDFTEVDSKLIIVSETMIVGFIPDGETVSQDTIDGEYNVKMVINETTLAENDFSMEDKDKINLYYFDDDSQNWLLLGGVLAQDTITVSTNRLGAFALGIEVNSMEDDQAPDIMGYAPQQGTVQTSFPEIYVLVADDTYGSGINLASTYMTVNGDTVDFSYNPDENKLFYQLTTQDNLNNTLVTVQVVCEDYAGNSSEVTFDFTLNVTSLEPDNKIPTDYVLYQNYPNPFNPVTIIKFGVPQKSSVEVNVYDIKGSYIKTIYKGEYEAGYHSVVWDCTNNAGCKVASGVYFYQVKAGKYNEVKKMMVLK